jgi:hypothetical protein
VVDQWIDQWIDQLKWIDQVGKDVRERDEVANRQRHCLGDVRVKALVHGVDERIAVFEVDVERALGNPCSRVTAATLSPASPSRSATASPASTSASRVLRLFGVTAVAANRGMDFGLADIVARIHDAAVMEN